MCWEQRRCGRCRGGKLRTAAIEAGQTEVEPDFGHHFVLSSHFDASPGKKVLNPSRDKIEGTRRSGEERPLCEPGFQ